MTEFDCVRPFKPPVLIGNWYNDRCEKEQKAKEFKMKQERGEVLLEKMRRVFDNFRIEVPLGAPNKHVPLGDIIQVVASQLSLRQDRFNPDIVPALSVMISVEVVKQSQVINDGCELTVAPTLTSYVRNSFKIRSARDDVIEKGEFLKFGQPFRLQCVKPNDDPLFLYTAPRCHDFTSVVRSSFEFDENRYYLGLVKQSNIGFGRPVPAAFTHWICQYRVPKKAFLFEGQPVAYNEQVIITHVATNRNLTAEQACMETFFGNEFMVTAQTCKPPNSIGGCRDKWVFMAEREGTAKEEQIICRCP